MPDLTLTSQLDYAQSLIDSGDDGVAVTVCRHILSSHPRCVQPYGLMAQAMLRRGAPQRAESLYARALSVDPQSCRSFLGMGLVKEVRGAHAAALAWMRSGAELASDRNTAPTWLAQAVSEIDQGPESGLSRVGLAYLMLNAGMHRQAASEFRSLLAVCPDRLDLPVALAETSYRIGDTSAASEACEDVLQRIPDCLKALLILGKLELSADASGRAREMLRRAQTLDPENRMAQLLFGGDSPLPPRSVRIPTAMMAEPLALPYLLDAEDSDEGDDDQPLTGLSDILQ